MAKTSLRVKQKRAPKHAVRAYTPGSYRGRMALVLPSRHWVDARRWRGVASVVEEHYGPDGCSSRDMLREPNAASIAKVFRTVLAAGEMP